MTDLPSSLQAHHQAVDAFLATASAVPRAKWTVPRAPGKWSPAQIADHLAVGYESNRSLLHGQAARGVPSLVRPMLRIFLFNPILRRGSFIPGSKTMKMLEPSATPAPPGELLGRLRSAANAFEADAAASAAANPTFEHPFFGRLALADWVRFQELHTRHHHAQMPSADA
jgi:hypothetical protein